jgi:DNA repair protein RecN (Recombination protein N)
MLEELRIHNFAIIDRLELEFSRGFNVITGETGTGKSIIIDAVDLLLGGKADADQIRAGAERATIEGVFGLNDWSRMMVEPLLRAEDLLESGDPGFVTLTREIRSNGRTAARINGVTVNLDILREVGQSLVDVHGQSEHLSLLRSRTHIDLLDRYADLIDMRDALATVVDSLSDVRGEIHGLREDKAALERRAESLRRTVEEIEAAELNPGEDDDLKAERNRLANSEQLATVTAEVIDLLSDDERDDKSNAVDQMMRVATLMTKLAGIDAELNDFAEIAESISAQAQELALEMAGYADTIEFDPDRINEIEERLELINTLKRRYGMTIELVIEHGEKARTELDNIEHSEERLEALLEVETRLLKQIGELGQNISKVRTNIGLQLSRRVVNELKDLRMERAQFEVHISQTDDPEGCYVRDRRVAFDSTGIDQIEFMMSANPGEPLRPLAKVASGGEAARIMLALKRVLSDADHTPTLIFDEVDQGIGGRVGTVVGEKLWALSASHQVLVVTHLPQLAGFADRHFHVRKEMVQNRTITRVVDLAGDDERVAELADMLGAIGESSKQNARDILDEARSRKRVSPA